MPPIQSPNNFVKIKNKKSEFFDRHGNQVVGNIYLPPIELQLNVAVEKKKS